MWLASAAPVSTCNVIRARNDRSDTYTHSCKMRRRVYPLGEQRAITNMLVRDRETKAKFGRQSLHCCQSSNFAITNITYPSSQVGSDAELLNIY